jgi:hypothetical protein
VYSARSPSIQSILVRSEKTRSRDSISVPLPHRAPCNPCVNHGSGPTAQTADEGRVVFIPDFRCDAALLEATTTNCTMIFGARAGRYSRWAFRDRFRDVRVLRGAPDHPRLYERAFPDLARSARPGLRARAACAPSPPPSRSRFAAAWAWSSERAYCAYPRLFSFSTVNDETSA